MENIELSINFYHFYTTKKQKKTEFHHKIWDLVDFDEEIKLKKLSIENQIR